MLRPLCQDVQYLLQRNYKNSQNHMIRNVFKRQVTCSECKNSLKTYQNICLKIKSYGFLPLVNLSRTLSSSSNGGNKPTTPVMASPNTSGNMAAAKSPGTGSGGSGKTKGEGLSPEEKKAKILKVSPRPRKVPLDNSYTDNIYITPLRAMYDYLLKQSQVETLPKYSTRRSAYASGNKTTLYLRTDVEALAVKVWGSMDQLNKEKERRNNETTPGKYDKRRIREIIERLGASDHHEDKNFMDAPPTEDVKRQRKFQEFLKTGSGTVILSAILINGFNTFVKFVAWMYTSSHSMFSEFVHSFADTVNQIMLALGLYHSIRKPDSNHPYGYTSLKHISSLISGVGIFFFGTGLSVYHGFQGLMHPAELGNLQWAIAVLLGSLASEGATLIVAIQQVRKSSKALNIRFREYVLRGYDPNVNVVLLEDLAAVVGVAIAASCMTLTHMTGSPLPDSIGSLLIGGLLGGVATFIIYTNTNALVGRSVPMYVKHDISLELERDRMIRSLHDVKATELGGETRFKAEVDFDGREITRAYLYTMDLEQLLAEAQNLNDVESLEKFMLNHGEKVVDQLGEEVDRIENILKAKHPELRHVDLEAL